MKVLVTGGSGFIGRRLAGELARRGHEVACLVRRTSITAPLEGLPIELVVGDLAEPSSLARAVAGRDRVFHLAGAVQEVDESAFHAVNVEGTRNLVEACFRAVPRPDRFVFVSSIAAAGPNPSERPAREDEPPRPVSAYGRSKLDAERVVLAAGTRLPVTIVRPPNVLGPGSKELEQAIRLLRWRIVPAIGDGRPRTSLIDVDDLAEALILAAERPESRGRTYYVTDGRAYAWPEITSALTEELGVRGPKLRVPFRVQLLAARLAEAAARRTGRPPRLTRAIVRAGREGFWIYDGSRIERELGFRPRFGMRDSVRRTIQAVRRNDKRRCRPGNGAKA
jgi:nucleoside-diphosphate-sugar epimerase